MRQPRGARFRAKNKLSSEQGGYAGPFKVCLPRQISQRRYLYVNQGGDKRGECRQKKKK